MENRGEVCLEEEVGRLRRSGMSVQKISDFTGLQPSWVETVVEMLPEDKPVPDDNRV